MFCPSFHSVLYDTLSQVDRYILTLEARGSSLCEYLRNLYLYSYRFFPKAGILISLVSGMEERGERTLSRTARETIVHKRIESSNRVRFSFNPNPFTF